MNLDGSRLAEKPDDVLCRHSLDDGIVYKYDALALNDGFKHVQLDLQRHFKCVVVLADMRL